MIGNKVKQSLLLGCVLLAIIPLSSGADAGASALDYTVTYRGMFSLGRDLQIADVNITEQTLVEGVQTARLDVTSAGYPDVESLYPIRYRFRSWTNTADGDLVGFETYQKTSKLRHRLYVRDGGARDVKRLDPASAPGREALAQLDTGNWPLPPGAGEVLFDRLSLLAAVRDLDLEVGRQYELPVTNGKERLRYQVTVERSQNIAVAGQPVAAWKVRFDGLEQNDRGNWEAAHRPIFIWFSQTPEHYPLRADNRHPIGLFRIELTRLPQLQAVARRGS